MKRVWKGTCFILILAMLLAVPVSAQEEITPYASIYFSRTETYLYIIDGNRFGIWFDVIATGTMEELGVCSVTVRKSLDGETWRNVKTFTPENYSVMISYDDDYHAGGLSYLGTYNYYYQARVEFYAKKGTGSGIYVAYTPILFLSVP